MVRTEVFSKNGLRYTYFFNSRRKETVLENIPKYVTALELETTGAKTMTISRYVIELPA